MTPVPHSGAKSVTPGGSVAGGHTVKTGWEPGGEHVVAALRGLTSTERRHVLAGYIGDCRPSTLNSLRRQAMFYLKIDSPNGRCGIMVLTPLGRNVQALLKERATKATAGETRNAEGAL